MGKIKWFGEYLQEIQDTIVPPAGKVGINYNERVIDDSQLTKYLSDIDTGKNLLLIGVIPDFGSSSSDGESIQMRASTQMMVLKKTSYSEYNTEEYHEIFEDTYDIAELIVKKLLDDHLSGGCTYLRFLKPETIQIIPVWNKSSCNGWSVLFNFDSWL